MYIILHKSNGWYLDTSIRLPVELRSEIGGIQDCVILYFFCIDTWVPNAGSVRPLTGQESVQVTFKCYLHDTKIYHSIKLFLCDKETNLVFRKNWNLYSYTEKPKWVIWLIWATVGQYMDKMTQKYVKNESFCSCSDPLWLKWVKWLIWVFLCSQFSLKWS